MEEVHPREEEDKEMKKLFLNSAFISILTVTLTGCYTVVWDPSQNGFPTKDNTNYDSGYYPVIDYGGYSGFYDSPWWFYISQPGTSTTNNNADPNGTVARNSGGGGRGSTVRDPWNGIISGIAGRNSSTQSSGNVNKSSTGSTYSNSRSGTSGSNEGSTTSRNSNGSRNNGNGRGR